jgi:hypothetical protein
MSDHMRLEAELTIYQDTCITDHRDTNHMRGPYMSDHILIAEFRDRGGATGADLGRRSYIRTIYQDHIITNHRDTDHMYH